MRGVVSGFTTLKSIVKIFSVWIFAFMIPKWYVWYHQPSRVINPAVVTCRNGVVPGADLLFAMQNNPRAQMTTTIGLVMDDIAELKHCAVTTDFLLKKGFHIKKIFVPWYAHLPASRTISVGRAHKVPIVRLSQEGTFSKQQLKGVDLLVFAMQDSRRSHAVYASSLAQTMKAATEYKKMLVIMDHHEGELSSWGPNVLKRYAWIPDDLTTAHKKFDHFLYI
jgi:hypothetical protein